MTFKTRHNKTQVAYYQCSNGSAFCGCKRYASREACKWKTMGSSSHMWRAPSERSCLGRDVTNYNSKTSIQQTGRKAVQSCIPDDNPSKKKLIKKEITDEFPLVVHKRKQLCGNNRPNICIKLVQM